MVHRACATSWTLMSVTWTSSPIRNQKCTRIQIQFQFRASFGFEFEQSQSTRRALAPILPIDPNEQAVDEELNARASRKRAHSPAETTVPDKRKRGTQTDVLGEYLDSLPRKYYVYFTHNTLHF